MDDERFIRAHDDPDNLQFDAAIIQTDPAQHVITPVPAARFQDRLDAGDNGLGVRPTDAVTTGVAGPVENHDLLIMSDVTRYVKHYSGGSRRGG